MSERSDLFRSPPSASFGAFLLAEARIASSHLKRHAVLRVSVFLQYRTGHTNRMLIPAVRSKYDHHHHYGIAIVWEATHRSAEPIFAKGPWRASRSFAPSCAFPASCCPRLRSLPGLRSRVRTVSSACDAHGAHACAHARQHV